MPDFDKLIQEMESLKGYVNGKIVERQSFASFVVAFVKVWKKLQSSIIKHIDTVQKQLTGKMSDISQQVENTEKLLKSELLDTKQSLSDKIENTRSVLEAQLEATTKLLKEEIEEPEDFSEIEEMIESIREQIPAKFDATEIEERISDLEDKIEELAKRKPTTIIQGGNGGVMGRDLVKDIDLSSQLNGVTKTFNTQAIHNVVSVALSSYPYGALRKNIDYTWTPTSITFTDTIDAPTQLASGQACILTVVQG